MFSCHLIVVIFTLLTYCSSLIIHSGEHIREGHVCFHTATGERGKCTLMKDCPTALAEKATGYKQVQMCSFSGEFSLVCCMPSVVTPPMPKLEGSSCTLKYSKAEGVCRDYATCPNAVQAASRGVLPQLCERNGVIPTGEEPQLVCCDETVSPRTGTKAKNYCRQLKARDEWKKAPQPPCSTRSGSMKTSQEAPHLAMLGEKRGSEFLWRSAAASLLSEHWLLGSAWSFARWPEMKFVGLGGMYKPLYSPEEVIAISKRVAHADLNGTLTWVYNDILLLQLERPVVFTAGIMPVCLYMSELLPKSQYRELTLINTAMNIKNEMEEVPWETCFREYAGNQFYPSGVKNTTQLCARPRPISGLKNLECEDYMYGAPLYWQGGDSQGEDGCSRLLLGSFTDVDSDQSCTKVFTRITAFLPWIENILWP